MNISDQNISVPILLVDDRPENLLSLEELLRGQDYELIRAMSGNEALLLTLRNDFALVLMDVQMPGMDGFETAELMRANPKTRQIPIIFVTAGMRDLQFQFKGYDSGAVDYLAKPIEPVFLQSKVKIFADLFRQKRELELHRSNLEAIVEQRTAELQKISDNLKASNNELQHRNRELKSTEELLRGQVVEFIETHDQLLATEEMLRVQIEEYEIGQKLLNEANRNLKTLFDVSPLAIVVSSFPDGVIREINKTFSTDFGYHADQVVGRTGLDIGLWADISERTDFLRQLDAHQSVAGFMVQIRTLSGETRIVLLYSNIIDFKDEECLLIVFMDVTEQKMMEDQIRQKQKMEVIGQLAGGVAHDFNNMLTAITGSAELLERHIRDNASAMKLLGTIQQAASRSADLTGQLLAFSRKGQKNIVFVHIHTTLHDVISLLERTIDKKITLETRFLAQRTCVTGDPTLLQNALLNLGVNARDAMPDGGVITFSTSNIFLTEEFCAGSGFSISPGDYIEIDVSDTGVGMTEDIIKHAFEPFFTTKELGKGTGLGLAAVYGTVTDHHGSVTINSRPGHGTVFKVLLPVNSEGRCDAVPPAEVVSGCGGILLADDEAVIRDVGQALLEEMGYTVFLAEDGQQALELYRQNSTAISLVILDMLMPKMSGKETLLLLKEKYPDARVLISSGFHQAGTVAELMKLGAAGFLQKPYIRQELSKAVTDAITGGDAR